MKQAEDNNQADFSSTNIRQIKIKMSRKGFRQFLKESAICSEIH